MNTSKTAARAALAAILCLGSVTLIACEERGPAEQTGERIDETIQDTKRGVEDATD